MKQLIFSLSVMALFPWLSLAASQPNLGMLHCHVSRSSDQVVLWGDDQAFPNPTYLGPTERLGDGGGQPVFRMSEEPFRLRDRSAELSGPIFRYVNGRPKEKLGSFRLISMGSPRVIRRDLRALGMNGCVTEANLLSVDVELEVSPAREGARLLSPNRSTISCEYLERKDPSQCKISRDSGGH